MASRLTKDRASWSGKSWQCWSVASLGITFDKPGRVKSVMGPLLKRSVWPGLHSSTSAGASTKSRSALRSAGERPGRKHRRPAVPAIRAMAHFLPTSRPSSFNSRHSRRQSYSPPAPIAATDVYTHDEDFFKASLCHSHYALVYLDVTDKETAEFIRRFLKHPAFDTQTKRLGLVVRVRPRAVQYWRKGRSGLQTVEWQGDFVRKRKRRC